MRWRAAGEVDERGFGADARWRIEHRLHRFRHGCLVLALVLLPLDPGDSTWLSALVLGTVAATALVVGRSLRRHPGTTGLRRIGALAMGADTFAVLLVLANNLSDPHHAKYLAVLLPVLEAAHRWGLRGGAAAGLAGAVAVVGWSVALAHRTGESFHAGPSATRAGVVLMTGLAVGALVRDLVQERRHADEGEQRYRSLFHHHPDAIYSFDLEGNYVEVNEGCEVLSGYGAADMLRHSFTEVVVPEDLDRVRAHFAAAASGEVQRYECAIRRLDGDRRVIDVTNVPVVVGGRVAGVYGIAKDITERRELEHLLRRQARRDPLTDLPNRIELIEHLGARLESSAPVWVLFIDLDRFKLVNDTLGHAMGDVLLRAAAARIRSTLRDGDLPARFAGDEFCVVLAPGTDSDGASAAARRVLGALDERFSLDGHEARTTASIGLAVGVAGDSADVVVQRADLAMYDAKAAGRARHVRYSRPGEVPAVPPLPLR